MSDQLRLDGRDQLKMVAKPQAPVECLGIVFDSDDARREHFLGLLAEKLDDPEFRKTPGFPTGQAEDILAMSDPPYYTACPNPFLGDFVRVHGRPYDPDEPYHRDPFAVDVSVGKTDALYKAHSYHTKVPHLAIVPSILHYTEPGDIVLDGFCGSGMTGVAAQFCGSAPAEYRMALDADHAKRGLTLPKWGARRAILSDLSPAASFIAAGYNLRIDVDEFEREATRILDAVDAELGWMYETSHADGTIKGHINYTVWSQVFSCPECGGEVVYLDVAMDATTKRVAESFCCESCHAELTRRRLKRLITTELDSRGRTFNTSQRRPILINYTAGGSVYEKRPDSSDMETLARASSQMLRWPLPDLPMMLVDDPSRPWGDEWRSGTASFRRVNEMYLPRAAASLGMLWSLASAYSPSMRRSLLWFVEQAILGLSMQNRYQPLQHGQPGGSQVNRYMSGRIRVLSMIAECNPGYVLRGKLRRLVGAFQVSMESGAVAIGVSDCSLTGLASDSIDYVFTDPPFGANFAYAELNFVPEAFHRVLTAPAREAIVSRAQGKAVIEYQDLMSACFQEYARVLKPGRWLTVVFSNSSNAIWRAIQEGIASAGFVVADVRTLDKQQGSFNQVHGVSVNQDLIISAYKPSAELENGLRIGTVRQDNAWAFVDEHLRNVPNSVDAGDSLEVVVERTPQMLHDRTVGFFVQRGLAVPLSTAEFMTGLAQRYPERDGMYFLPEQVAEYDKRRAKVDSVEQLAMLVTDESSAIQWLRQQLGCKPQSFSELQPTFMREAQQSWAKHELQIELRELLEENFLLFDGKGPVPSQIKSYLSTNWREYRNLEPEDPALQAKAKDRWYVPDPGKAADLVKLRERQLVREFEEYQSSKARTIKLFRTEAVRAGFKRAYDERDWATIVAVAERLPESVVQEDEKLLMYYDVARMRVG